MMDMTDAEPKPKRKKKTKLERVIDNLQAKMDSLGATTAAQIKSIEDRSEAEMCSLRDTIKLLREQNGLK